MFSKGTGRILGSKMDIRMSYVFSSILHKSKAIPHYFSALNFLLMNDNALTHQTRIIVEICTNWKIFQFRRGRSPVLSPISALNAFKLPFYRTPLRTIQVLEYGMSNRRLGSLPQKF